MSSAAYRASHRKELAEKQRAYYVANRDKVLATSAIYRAANHEKILAAQAVYRAADPERIKRWRAANPQLMRASSAAYRASHHTEIAARQRAWRSDHTVQNQDRFRNWVSQHRGLMCGYERRRRALKAGVPGFHTAADILGIRDAQDGTCFWCGVALGNDYHIDHLYPLSGPGSSDGPENLVLTCPTCNTRKGAKDPDLFLTQLLSTP